MLSTERPPLSPSSMPPSAAQSEPESGPTTETEQPGTRAGQSPLKQRPKTTSRARPPATANAKQPRSKQDSTASARQARDSLVFGLQEKLFEGAASPAFLLKCCEHLSARNYHDVVCERAEAVRICGYPLCPKSITAVTTSKFIVKAGEKRIVKNEVLKMYCSEICMVRSMWIHRQLEEGHRKIQILGNNSAGESVVRNVITHHVDRMLASFSQSTTVNVLVSEREDPNPAENHPQYRNADNADAFRVDGYEYDKSMPLSLDQRLKDLSINPSLPLPRSNLDSPSSTSTSADGPKDIGKSAQTKGSDSENSSEDESEAEISEPDSDDEDPPVSISDFLIPSQRSKPEDLSVFGSLWSFLSRTVTPSTEKCLRLMDFDDAVNPNMLENEETRQRIFSQNFGTAFNALVRSSTPLERDLASLISSMHFSHPKYALLDRQHMERLVVILVGLLDATLAKTLEVVVDASWGSEWTILRRVFHEDSNI